MARPYRLQSEDCFYHITSRGNDKKKIFLNDTDFEKFLEYIVTAKVKYDFYLLAYVLRWRGKGRYRVRKEVNFYFPGTPLCLLRNLI